MAKTLKITIQFLDYWHCGSGESGGNESDALVVRYETGEKKGLPYVPGKTIKGLVREMVEVLVEDTDKKNITCKELHQWFGNTSNKEEVCFEKEEVKYTPTHMSNGDIEDKIESENIPYLFKTFKNTKLTNGIAQEGTLREIETVVPVTVVAYFRDVEADEDQLKQLINAIQSIKRIGLNRNRGMGRCEVTVEEV
jgi:CRISPR/Cas system CSM-associated protein Csm3 (group 7 of RAMP superfamily)